jgi:hypothetical protein
VDSLCFWGGATLQVLHYLACQLSLASRAHITPIQERVCKLPDVVFQFPKPFNVILDVSTTGVKPISYLSPKLHRLAQLHDLLFCNVEAKYYNPFGLLLSLTPSRIQVVPFIMMSIAPWVFCA